MALRGVDIMSIAKVPMTPQGYEDLENELKKLKTVDRSEIVKAIAEARAHGDLSENAEYHAAKEQQGMNEARISDLEDRVARAEVIDVSKLSGDQVKFGAKIELVDEDTEEEVTYQIVGEDEADLKVGKISVTSPVARAMMGKKTGDSVEVNTPGGGRYFEILGVKFG